MAFVNIINGLQSQDPVERSAAEQQVMNSRESDLAGFIVGLLRVARDDNNNNFVRQMALNLLKNAIAPNLREVAARLALEEKWKQLPPNIRQEVKTEVLQTLGSNVPTIRSGAANLIGSLARIELPAGEWPELINILTQAVLDSGPQYQEAALTAIGYICEEGQEYEEVEDAIKPYTGNILNAIVHGMVNSTDETVKYSATNALLNSMEYIHENMSQANQRDYLLNAICTIASSCDNLDTRSKAMYCLEKVASLYYDFLPAYISRLHEITMNAITKDDSTVGIPAVGFWISVAEQEAEMKENGEQSLGYCVQGVSFLVDLCFSLLVQQEEGQNSESDWNLSIAATRLLQVMGDVVGAPLQQPVMNFVFNHVNSQNWREQEAALTAFGCLASTTDDEARLAIQDTVAQATNENGLLRYVQDPNPLVADTCGWLLGIVCANYAEIFLQNRPLLERLFTIICPMIQNEVEVMFGRACDIISNLCLAFEEQENAPTNEISPYFSTLLEILMQAIDNSATFENRKKAQDTLNTLIVSAANDSAEKVLLPLVPNLLERLSQQYGVLSSGNASEEMESMIGVMAGAVSECARKLKTYFEPYVANSMELLLAILEVPNVDYIQIEVLIAVGEIVHSVPGKKIPGTYLERILQYVVRALRDMIDEVDNIFSVVSMVGDLCLGCKEDLAPYAPGIMNLIDEALNDPEMDRELKTVFLNTIGDIALSVLPGRAFSPYLTGVLTTINSMFEFSCQLDLRGDNDTTEYVMNLWHAISECYSNIMQSYKEEDVGALSPFFAGMVKFIFHVVEKSTEVETTSKAIMLIGDMASILRKAAPALRQSGKAALCTPAVQGMLQQICATNTDKELNENIRWVERQVLALQRA